MQKCQNFGLILHKINNITSNPSSKILFTIKQNRWLDDTQKHTFFLKDCQQIILYLTKIMKIRLFSDQLCRWAEVTRLNVQLSHYSLSLLSGCMMRSEFVWPPWGSTKAWIQRGGPRGQAGSRPSRAAPASHHLHAAPQPASLGIIPPPLVLLPDKPHLHPSHLLLPLLLISASDLSITQPEFYVTATLWPQLQMLLSFCRRADFHILQERRLTASLIWARQPKMTFFLHL